MVLSKVVPLASLVVKNGTKKLQFFGFKTCLTAISLAPSLLNIYEICLMNIILGNPGNVSPAISYYGVIPFMGQILIF